MILKNLIHDIRTNSVEATWTDLIDGVEVVVKCHSYADVQMDLLRADLGEDAPLFEDLMVLVAAGIIPAAPPTPEQQRQTAKAERAQSVAAITATTQAGHTFDGDEVSQGRMVRAIVALQATGTPSITWVLADNSVIEASAAELTEALALAGAAQAAIWVIE